MKIKFYIIPIILFTSLATSCYYDKAQLLYGLTPCVDTIGVASYSLKVVPILNQQCYSCHIGRSASGGIVMGNYTADRAIGLNGKLFGSISHASGYIAMPKGSPKMNDCTINVIKKWIDNGLLNN